MTGSERITMEKLSDLLSYGSGFLHPMNEEGINIVAELMEASTDVSRNALLLRAIPCLGPRTIEGMKKVLSSGSGSKTLRAKDLDLEDDPGMSEDRMTAKGLGGNSYDGGEGRGTCSAPSKICMRSSGSTCTPRTMTPRALRNRAW